MNTAEHLEQFSIQKDHLRFRLIIKTVSIDEIFSTSNGNENIGEYFCLYSILNDLETLNIKFIATNSNSGGLLSGECSSLFELRLYSIDEVYQLAATDHQDAVVSIEGALSLPVYCPFLLWCVFILKSNELE